MEPAAQLRASIALDRPLLESSFKPHTRKLSFTNPYRTAIGGTLKLKAPTGWTISPPTFNFTLNPGERFDRELTIEFPYNSFAGRKTIQAEVSVQADTNTTFALPIALTHTRAWRAGPTPLCCVPTETARVTSRVASHAGAR